MNLRAVGCNFRTAEVGLRERLAFDTAAQQRALTELAARFGCEAVLLSTCNRVELFVARPVGEHSFDAGLAAEFFGESRGVPATRCRTARRKSLRTRCRCPHPATTSTTSSPTRTFPTRRSP